MTGSEHAASPSEVASSTSARAAAVACLLEMREVMVVGLMSESHVDGEEEAAGRREWCEVDEPADLLIAEVAHLGVGAQVFGPGEKGAAAELQPHRARPAGESVPPLY